MTEIHDALKQVESANTTTVENGSVSTTGSDLTIAPGGAGAKVVLTTNSKDIEIYDGDISSAVGALSLTPQSGVLSVVGATQTLTIPGNALWSSVGTIDVVGASETITFDNSDISNSAGSITVTPFDGTAAVVGATDTMSFTSGVISTNSGDLDLTSAADISLTSNSRITKISGRDITYTDGYSASDLITRTIGHISAAASDSAAIGYSTTSATISAGGVIWVPISVPTNSIITKVTVAFDPGGISTTVSLIRATWNASSSTTVASVVDSSASDTTIDLTVNEDTSSYADHTWFVNLNISGSNALDFFGLKVTYAPAGPDCFGVVG